MFETMAELEATCARLAAQRMTPGERGALERLHARSAQLVYKGALDSYEAANLTFHAAIYAGAHNEFLESTTLAVRARLAPFRGAQFRVTDRLTRSFSEHAEIVHAIGVHPWSETVKRGTVLFERRTDERGGETI
jgi:DNA-binding GntR family transcriptional regulator